LDGFSVLHAEAREDLVEALREVVEHSRARLAEDGVATSVRGEAHIDLAPLRSVGHKRELPPARHSAGQFGLTQVDQRVPGSIGMPQASVAVAPAFQRMDGGVAGTASLCSA